MKNVLLVNTINHFFLLLFSLSGTPIQNDLGEFHAMVNFVNPGVIGDPATFRSVFEQPILTGREPESEVGVAEKKSKDRLRQCRKKL
jgi:SNF2 family DNA or RNA helicase